MADLNLGGEKPALYLEHLRVGQRFLSGTHRVDEEQIRAFADQFDPRPFHLDAPMSSDRRAHGPGAFRRWICFSSVARRFPDGPLYNCR
jgi:acyl dehydratase